LVVLEYILTVSPVTSGLQPSDGEARNACSRAARQGFATADGAQHTTVRAVIAKQPAREKMLLRRRERTCRNAPNKRAASAPSRAAGEGEPVEDDGLPESAGAAFFSITFATFWPRFCVDCTTFWPRVGIDSSSGRSTSGALGFDLPAPIGCGLLEYSGVARKKIPDTDDKTQKHYLLHRKDMILRY